LRRGSPLPGRRCSSRGEPLAGGEPHVVGTVEHSVRGPRGVYVGTEDEGAVACFRPALAGEQEQAELQIWNEDRLVETKQQQVVISRHTDADDARSGADQNTETKTVIPRVLGEEINGKAQLLARWGEEQAVVAALI